MLSRTYKSPGWCVAQWMECWPVTSKVPGSIPSQDTCLGCMPGPLWGRARSNRLMFLSSLLSVQNYLGECVTPANALALGTPDSRLRRDCVQPRAQRGSSGPGTGCRPGRLSAGGGVPGCEGRSCPLSLTGSSSAQLSVFDNFIIHLFINSSTAVRKRKRGPILGPDFWKPHSTRHHTV